METVDLKCRGCGSGNTGLVLDLGSQPLANNLLGSPDLADGEPRFSLQLAICRECWLLQIVETVPPTKLFSEYLYFSSFSDTMLSHARDIALRCIASEQLGPASFVVEIASNDGYLLKNYVGAGIRALGVEPATNIAAVARQNGVPTTEAFFGAEVAASIVSTHGKADVIHANNVFAHAPAIHDFVAGLSTLLADDGVAVIEFPYAVEMIEKLEFDTIYHEHVFYFTLRALMPVFESHSLSIHDCERLDIHGGSLRLYVGRSGGRPASGAMTALVAEEIEKGVASPEFYRSFSRRVKDLRRSLLDLVQRLKSEGKSLAAYGASAKGSTLLNYYGLGRGDIAFVADRSTYKQGKFTPGTHIPIVPPEELLRSFPDYVLLLTWNFADEIMKQQREYRSRGGRFILPLPHVLVAA